MEQFVEGVMHCKRFTVAFMLICTLITTHGSSLCADTGSSSFTPQQREYIDQNAIWGPREEHNVATLEAHGSVLGWLVDQWSLPVEEEVKFASKKHEEVVEQYDVVTTPDHAQAIFDQLVQHLPKRMRPDAYEFSLTVVDQDDADSFSLGAGRVYVSQALVKQSIDRSSTSDDNPASGPLAFALAHELGHISLEHARRVYKRLWLHEQIAKDVNASPDQKAKSRKILERLRGYGVMLQKSYTRDDDYLADLFAVHLCRNADFDLENCLDYLRKQTVAKDKRMLDQPPARVGFPPTEPLVRKAKAGDDTLLAEPPTASHRLRRLRLELDGLVYRKGFGLFELSRDTGKLQPVTEGSIVETDRVVICIHGMESDLHAFEPLMKHMAEHDSSKSTRILGFQYPADGSLARSAKFLGRELRRTMPDGAHLDFVCHSAGGLIFRHYAEIQNGSFHRAYLQATPHEGSDLAKLRSVIELKQFLGDINLGYDAALTKVIQDGRGQITHDLLPGSLFLSYLNRSRKPSPRKRYLVYRGQILSRTQAFAAKVALKLALRSVEKKLDTAGILSVRAKLARAALAKIEIPKEVANGDLCVTTDSAYLKGVKELNTLKLIHTSMPHNPKLMTELAKHILDDE